MQQKSLIVHISFALAAIVAIAIATMATSYWISDRGETHAHAINLAGSLRMQSYRLGLVAIEHSPESDIVQASRAAIENTWQHSIFSNLRGENAALAQAYEQAYQQWLFVEQALINQNPSPQRLQLLLDEQVALIEHFVQSIQQHNEANGRLLRLIQVIALFLILGLSVAVSYWLNIRVAQPLSQLTRLAQRVARGDYAGTASIARYDELGLLADSFNHMSQAIAHMHGRMEERIAEQTQQLRRSNALLEFLYDTAKTIIEQEPHGIDYQAIVNRLAGIAQIDDIELCLFNETGSTPYSQINTHEQQDQLCTTRHCAACLRGELISFPHRAGINSPVYRYSFPLVREHHHYGVIGCYLDEGDELATWQQQLIKSVADQLSLALSLEAQEDNARRLSLAQERAVIARELHDSLAQSLSYLKIQVTRLNRALANQDQQTLQEVARELQEGLDDAYRQLRELLTTFRLKITGPGLLQTLQSSIQQLSEQTDMTLSLDYTINNIPLTPNEEIHLLQIIREAMQNAVNHSQGSEVTIRLRQDTSHQVRLSVEDNGIGIADNPAKLNHYGLTSMQERSLNLGGELAIDKRPEGGTGVYFAFTPQSLQQQNMVARDG